MYIVRPELDDEAVKTASDSVRDLIESQGGELVKSTNWGRRRLAYEVRHLRDGYYVLADIRMDGNKVGDLERALRIHDQVFRHLLVTRESTGAGAGVSAAPPIPSEPDGAEESEELEEAVVDEVALDEAPSALDEEEI